MPVQYDEYGRPVTPVFREPMDFVHYVDSLPPEQRSPGSVRQAEEIRRNPNGWVMSQGHPRKKDDWAARHVPQIAAGTIGALVGAPYLAKAFGGGTAATSATAATPNYVPASVIGTGLPGGVAAKSGWATGGLAPVRKGLGRQMLNRVAGGGGDQVSPWLQAALASLAGLPGFVAANRGPSDEEKRLYAAALQMAEQDRLATETRNRRTNFQNPLFDAVTRLAMSRLPTTSQRALPETF